MKIKILNLSKLSNVLITIFFAANIFASIPISESLDICLTPDQSCLPSIIKSLDGAKSKILLLGYSFTSKPITEALISAKNRGVEVRLVLDHSQQFQKSSKESVELLLANRIDVLFDHSVKIAHNKIIIVDDYLSITGSYNWSHSAEFNNAENLIFIKSNDVAKKYTEYFENRCKAAKLAASKKLNVSPKRRNKKSKQK